MAAAVAAGRVVRVVSLGRVGYAQALAVQTRLARALLDHLAVPSGPAPPDTLLLCEHDPVYTVGIRQAPYPAEVETRLRALGADFHRTNRGGLITFHGPGQLVCYPVLHLARHRRSLRWYVCQLERVAADACRDLGVPAHSHEQHTGVWVGERKICAIGERNAPSRPRLNLNCYRIVRREVQHNVTFVVVEDNSAAVIFIIIDPKPVFAQDAWMHCCVSEGGMRQTGWKSYKNRHYGFIHQILTL
uniref:lipoyl(octanoyl) transferase n=1 Tax=Petromyzon marinus TaxID=7757 RepID=A0AAJ7U1D7_PETMA|nr:putative lipoyltransferase 2, mitochondrial isoform X1 [Petromyzon marinus]